MFSKDTYISRRKRLSELVGSGIILLLGNNDSPCNYPANAYKFRQDSSFLYYFGQKREGLVGVIDIDNQKEYLFGDDIDIDDIIWFGYVPSVSDLGQEVGVAHSGSMKDFCHFVEENLKKGVTIHYLPPYRDDHKILLSDLLGIHPYKQKESASVKLIKSVVKMRAVKTAEEIEEIERAMAIGYKMHTTAMRACKPGVKWLDMHLDVARMMTDMLKQVGLMKGNTEDAVQAGAHAMFFPHGLGHMMGMDVHDMEGLGQNYVGFDDEVQPSTQFGLNCLRCGRRLEPGFVMTDEPGIYFIPHLIDLWQSQGLHKDFICYDKLDAFRDFGGIRLEDDLLITESGNRVLGEQIIPYHPKDVEEFVAKSQS